MSDREVPLRPVAAGGPSNVSPSPPVQRIYKKAAWGNAPVQPKHPQQPAQSATIVGGDCPGLNKDPPMEFVS